MLTKSIAIDQKLHDYLLEWGGIDSPQLQKIREIAAQHPMEEMQSTAAQGQLIYFLAKLINAKNILELGVFLGYGTLVAAMAVPEDGRVIACDIDENNPKKGAKCWDEAGIRDKIDLKIMPALDLLSNLQQEITDNKLEPFDLAFVDADKAKYAEYYEMILPLIRKGGLIILDNTLWKGNVAKPETHTEDKSAKALHELNMKIMGDPRVVSCLVPLADGMSLLVKQ